LMQMEDGRIENHRIMSHKPASLREIVDIFCRVTGLSPQIAWGARPYRQREMMAPWTGGTTLPAWRPLVGIEEGILRMHSHYVLNTRN
jgi:nucleoside-diphosphate-sugar epimerase